MGRAILARSIGPGEGQSLRIQHLEVGTTLPLVIGVDKW